MTASATLWSKRIKAIHRFSFSNLMLIGLLLCLTNASYAQRTIDLSACTGNPVTATTELGFEWITNYTRGDVDGDGDIDLLGKDVFTDELIYFTNDGNGNFTEQAESDNPFSGVVDQIGARELITFKLGDLDNDGDADFTLIENVGTLSNPVYSLLILINNQTDNILDDGFAPFTSSPNIISISIDDMDGDNDNDIILGDFVSSSFIVMGNLGSFSFALLNGDDSPITELNGSTIYTTESVNFFDVDTDGDLDIIKSNTISTRYFTNDGSDNFTEQTGLNNPWNDVIPANNTFISDLFGSGTEKFYICSQDNQEEITCTAMPIIVPVELLSFDAQKHPEHIEVNWSTASEQNARHFEVEKSTDGIDFYPIGKVDAIGYSDTEQAYTFRDREVKLGTSYYRLKQVDYDGKFEYSRLVSLEVDNLPQSNLSIYPNPATSVDPVTLLLNADVAGKATIEILTIDGNIVTTTEQQVSIGRNPYDLSLQSLPSGIYIIRVHSGGTVQSVRLVK